MPDKIKQFYEFEEFRLDAANPSLWRGGDLVSISPKALETLILLVERRGEIVSRDELLKNVWKETFVEESNINYTISLLRKALDNKNLIQTIPRRGYRFLPEVREIFSRHDVVNFPESAPQNLQSITEKSSRRWALIGILLIGVLFLASSALWWGDGARSEQSKTLAAENSDAMQAYRRGKMILEKRNVEDREEKAIYEFQKAITLDPTFPAAYAGLSEVYSAISIKTNFPESRENYAKAKTAAEKSLALDVNLAEGYSIRGWLKRNTEWNWREAESDLRRAIDLDPQNATAHFRLSHLLAALGRTDQALAEINLAYELDPISDYVLGGHFPILESRGEYTKALKLAEEFLRENKENYQALRAYGTFLLHLEQYAQLIETGERFFEKHPEEKNFAWVSLLSTAYRETGQSDKAEALLDELRNLAETDTKALYSLAMNYAEIDRPDKAIAALEKCFEMREERMVWIYVEPRFANLRNDSRFQELLRKMRLP